MFQNRFVHFCCLVVSLQKIYWVRASLICVFVFVFSISAAFGLGVPNEKYSVIYNYENDWLAFDQDAGIYVPYQDENTEGFNTFSIEVELAKYPKAFLVIKTSDAPANIFINNKLKKSSTKSEWLTFSLDELKRESKSAKLYLTFFSIDKPADFVAYIGFPSESKTKVSETFEDKNMIKLLPKGSTNFNSGLALAFVVCLILSSFISGNYYRVYNKYYVFKEVFSTRVKDDILLTGKPLDRPGFLFIILTGVVIGIILLALQSKGYSIVSNNLLFQFGDTFGSYAINFFKFSLLAFLVLVLNYFYLTILGQLFNLSKITDLHYLKLLQFNLFTASIIVLVLFFFHSFYIIIPENMEYYVVMILIGLLVWRTVLIFFSINKEANVNFLYLFSYLCVAEALPVIAAMRFLS